MTHHSLFYVIVPSFSPLAILALNLMFLLLASCCFSLLQFPFSALCRSQRLGLNMPWVINPKQFTVRVLMALLFSLSAQMQQRRRSSKGPPVVRSEEAEHEKFHLLYVCGRL